MGAGKRLLWLEFEGGEQNEKNKGFGVEPPIAVEYNKLERELVVATKRDVRIIDLDTGRTKKVWAHFLKEEAEGTEITQMLLGVRCKYLILSTSSGKISSYSYRTGKPYFENAGHRGQDVTTLILDSHHHLLVSGGSDSSLQVQAEVTKDEPSVLRATKSAHLGQDI